MRSCQFNTMTSLYPASKHILHASHTGSTNLVLGVHELCAAYSTWFLFTSSVCSCSTKHQNVERHRFQCSTYILCGSPVSFVLVDISNVYYTYSRIGSLQFTDHFPSLHTITHAILEQLKYHLIFTHAISPFLQGTYKFPAHFFMLQKNNWYDHLTYS